MNDYEYYSNEKKLMFEMFELEASIEQKYQFVEALTQSTSVDAKKLSVKYLREIQKLESKLSDLKQKLDELKKEFYSDGKLEKKAEKEYPEEINVLVEDSVKTIESYEQSERMLIMQQSRKKLIEKELSHLKRQNFENEEIQLFIDIFEDCLNAVSFDLDKQEKIVQELSDKSSKAVAELHDALHCFEHGTWKPKQME